MFIITFFFLFLFLFILLRFLLWIFLLYQFNQFIKETNSITKYIWFNFINLDIMFNLNLTLFLLICVNFSKFFLCLFGFLFKLLPMLLLRFNLLKLSFNGIKLIYRLWVHWPFWNWQILTICLLLNQWLTTVLRFFWENIFGFRFFRHIIYLWPKIGCFTKIKLNICLVITLLIYNSWEFSLVWMLFHILTDSLFCHCNSSRFFLLWKLF